ncbi:hypothetical protein IMCC26256_11105 [Actinobacteria bacterium IMCC26256]|nr:hypothetical protein IMCC26256_11105 [Actinobacteria bacterium IMCC26256]
MPEELRIYYECLEQARHFVAPIAQTATGILADPIFIEISKATAKSVIAKSLAMGLALRNPDAIVTVVRESVEIPLVWIEFTTQVYTEDHALQGFNSFVAAGNANIPFVKIVARRVSASDHGGATNFDYRQPFRILWRDYGTPSVQLEWPLSEDATTALRNLEHKACPPEDLGLGELLEVAYKGACSGGSASEAIRDYAIVSRTPLAQNIAENMADVGVHIERLRSTRFYRRADGRWELKFNRWGHSMDPERGMAEFYGSLLKVPLAGRLNDPKANNAEEALVALRRHTGINIPLAALTNKRIFQAEQFILNSALNRAGLIIAWYCDEFTIGDRDGNTLVTIKWVLGKPDGLKVLFSTADVTKIVEKTHVTEDDVTYVVANETYPKNGFVIQSVSYPGAQGDLGVLTGAGRAVRRKFFDVIATKIVGAKTVISITESKGSAQRSIIQPDIDTVLSWRDDSANRKNLLTRIGEKMTSIVLASIAYPGSKVVPSNRGADLDMVILVEPDEWQIWAPLNSSVLGIDVPKGVSNLPVRYKY